MSYVWDAAQRRYRHAASGEVVSWAEVRRLRAAFLADQAPWADDLAAMLANGQLTLPRWEEELRGRIRRVYVASYALGRGGTRAMTDADDAALDGLLLGQYGYLRAFAEQVGAGELSEATVASRSADYLGSSAQAFARGYAAAYGLPMLDHWPADGTTQCGSRCRCHLSIEEYEDRWEVRWQDQGGGRECEDCAALGASWSPLVLWKADEAA